VPVYCGDNSGHYVGGPPGPRWVPDQPTRSGDWVAAEGEPPHTTRQTLHYLRRTTLVRMEGLAPLAATAHHWSGCAAAPAGRCSPHKNRKECPEKYDEMAAALIAQLK